MSQIRPAQQLPGKLTFLEKSGYGLGDMASCLIWQTISLYLTIYYTDIFGLSAAAAGFMIMVLRWFDAVVDPMVGMIADRTQSRWGKYRPYLLWGSVPLAIMVVLTFTTPNIAYSGKLIYAYITYGLMMIVYSIINIPYSSMLGVLTSNPAERTQLSSFKFAGAYFGGLIVSAALLPLAKYVSPGNPQKGWQLAMMIFGAISVGLYFLTFLSTKERVQPPVGQKTSISKDIVDLVTNGPWVILLFVSLSMIMFVASRMNVAAYYFKYYVGKQIVLGRAYDVEWLTSAFNTIGMITSILGVIAVSWVAKYLGKKNTFLLFFVIACIATGSFYILKPQQVMLMFIFQGVGSFVGGPLSTLIWAMYADTADFGEWKFQRRATGLIFSAAIMAQKFGWAIGAGFTGWMLSKYGYNPNGVQNGNVLELLRSLMSTIPLLCGIVSIIVVLFYKLDDKMMKTIEQDLNERRKVKREK